MYNEPTFTKIRHESISCSTAGNNTIVSAATGKELWPVSMVLQAAEAVDVYVTCTSGSMIASAATPLKLNDTTSATAGFMLPKNEFGWSRTGAGEAIVLNLSTSVSVCGCITVGESG